MEPGRGRPQFGLSLGREELDNPHKPKTWHCFRPEFRVRVRLSEPDEGEATAAAAAAAAAAVAKPNGMTKAT